MLLADILVEFERFSYFRWGFPERLFSELSEIGIFLDQIGVIIDVVHDDMKQGNSSTRIFGVLLHEEDVICDFILL
jgi:hypothetical protein